MIPDKLVWFVELVQALICYKSICKDIQINRVFCIFMSIKIKNEYCVKLVFIDFCGHVNMKINR